MHNTRAVLSLGKYGGYGKRSGNVADVLTVGICVITMTIIMMAYMGSVQMLDRKAQIDQVARKYILRMETVGYLTANDKLQLSQELQQLGAYELDFDGTTSARVDYGTPITLVIQGKINGTTMETGNGLFGSVASQVMYEFEERRMSTAKN